MVEETDMSLALEGHSRACVGDGRGRRELLWGLAQTKEIGTRGLRAITGEVVGHLMEGPNGELAEEMATDDDDEVCSWSDVMEEVDL